MPSVIFLIFTVYFSTRVIYLGVFCWPKKQAVPNSKLRCSYENNFNSVCAWLCKDGYGFNDVKLRKTRCFDKDRSDLVGFWTKKDPACERNNFL